MVQLSVGIDTPDVSDVLDECIAYLQNAPDRRFVLSLFERVLRFAKKINAMHIDSRRILFRKQICRVIKLTVDVFVENIFLLSRVGEIVRFEYPEFVNEFTRQVTRKGDACVAQ